MRKLSTVLLVFIGLSSYAFGAEKPQVERPTTEQETCITEECHTEHTSKPVIHDPVSEGSCEACHETVDVKEHTYRLTGEEPGICTECHDELSKEFVHSALDDGTCNQCHETHSSENEFRLLAPTVGDMCAECHEVAIDATHVHGPTSVGECTLCHDAHESDHEDRLVLGLDELCVFCHVTTKEELEGIEFVH
ncbi:MAG: cytochrome c3 family protein, partial [Planctomycetota bacterium]